MLDRSERPITPDIGKSYQFRILATSSFREEGGIDSRTG